MVFQRPAAVDVIEIPTVTRIDFLAAAVAEDVAADDSRCPLPAKPAVVSAVPVIVLGLARLPLAVTKTEPVTDRDRDEVDLAARFSALSVAVSEHHESSHLSGTEIPGRGWAISSPVARTLLYKWVNDRTFGRRHGRAAATARTRGGALTARR